MSSILGWAPTGPIIINIWKWQLLKKIIILLLTAVWTQYSFPCSCDPLLFAVTSGLDFPLFTLCSYLGLGLMAARAAMLDRHVAEGEALAFKLCLCN